MRRSGRCEPGLFVMVATVELTMDFARRRLRQSLIKLDSLSLNLSLRLRRARFERPGRERSMIDENVVCSWLNLSTTNQSADRPRSVRSG